MKFIDRCEHAFSESVRSRGQAYYRENKVAIKVMRRTEAEALVAASDTGFYRVFIDWYGAPADLLQVNCNCFHFSGGAFCKHIWATLLQLDRQPVAKTIPGRGPFQLERAASDDAVDDDAGETYAGDWSGYGNRSRAAGRGTPSWHKALAKVRSEEESISAIPWNPFDYVPQERRAWYLLDMNEQTGSESVSIDVSRHEANKSGEFGATREFAFGRDDIDRISDPKERDLLHQLSQFAQNSSFGEARSFGSRYSVVYGQYSSTVTIPAALLVHLIPQLVATGRFVWDNGEAISPELCRRIAWDDGEPLQFRVSITADDTHQVWEVSGHFCRGDSIRAVQDVTAVLPAGMLLDRDTLYRFDGDEEGSWVSMFQRTPVLEVPYADRNSFLKYVFSLPDLPAIDWPKSLALVELREKLRPQLRIHAPKERRNELDASLSFLYGEHELKVDNQAIQLVDDDGVLYSIVRDIQQERAHIVELRELPMCALYDHWSSGNDFQFHRRHLTTIVHKLVEAGWRVEAEGKLIRSPGKFNIEVTSEIDWFELEATCDFEGLEAKLPELLAAVRKGARYIELGDGTQGLLPEDWFRRYARLADLGQTEDGAVRFRPSQALLLDTLLAEQENCRFDNGFSKFRDRLNSINGIQPKNAPRTFHGTLRDYQRNGLGWFQLLRELGCGGCLADDMGLGKTVQVLALLENRRTRRLKKGEERRPSIVVAPKSLIFNWIAEASHFTPNLRVADYTGSDRKQMVDRLQDYHLIVTTYGTLRRDIVHLKDCLFDYAVLDESQAIKNASSQAAKASLLVNAKHRLALSGTPIENHLGELWSLFEFLNPGMLGQSNAFTSLCKTASRDDPGSLAALSRAIAPFVLRRTKKQVLKELPDKTEQTVLCDLSPKERKKYDELRDYYRAMLTKKISQQGLKRSKIHVLEAPLRLRQAACHQGLVDKSKASQSSAKLDVLMDQIHSVVNDGHKALVFSQFTSFLAIVRQRLEREGIRYEYLDGQTRKRKEPVERFQSDETCPLFLISLKAGGHGLNLTAADYVFILDPWWNPAVEAQAIDRTHRIGQTRHVFAYRIIARNTVEEKVLLLQKSKRELADAIITANESLIRTLTPDDLKLILS